MTHRCQSSPSAGCTRAACGKEDGRLQLAECNSIFSHSQANTAQYCAELCVCACIHGISQSCSFFPALSSQIFLSFILSFSFFPRISLSQTAFNIACLSLSFLFFTIPLSVCSFGHGRQQLDSPFSPPFSVPHPFIAPHPAHFLLNRLTCLLPLVTRLYTIQMHKYTDGDLHICTYTHKMWLKSLLWYV